MKRLPPAKRNMLIIVSLGTVVLIGLIYLFLIHPQNESNSELASNTKLEKAKLEQYKKSIKQASDKANLLKDISSQLSRAENDIAVGDVYAWTYDTLRRFKTDYQVEIPTIGQPVPRELDLLPGLPYKQVKVTLNGTGYFHDIGKFAADFENHFPHMRLTNLQMEPVKTQPGTASERLSFQMEVVLLVKSNS